MNLITRETVRLLGAAGLGMSLVASPAAAGAQMANHGPELIGAVNAIRAQNSLPPYMHNALLDIAALREANYMASTGLISHVGPDGSTVRNRARDAGYPGFSWGLMVGENIYGGQMGSVAAAMDWWMHSAIHRWQILNTRFTELGAASAVGASGASYYVLVFGSRPNAPLPQAAASATAPSPSTVPANGQRYLVQPGDTLSGIAKTYGVSVSDLMSWNGLSDANHVTEGETLLVSRNGSTGVASSALTSSPSANYTVQVGDTLWSIATRYNFSVDDLVRWNNLDPTAPLPVGKKLVLSSSAAPPVPPPPPLAVPAGSTNYIVQPGDTLLQIARNQNVAVDDLLRLNGLSSDSLLSIGEQLVLRQPTGAATTPLSKLPVQPVDVNNPPAGAQVYTVQGGDTVLGIAQRFGINPDNLVTLNGLPDSDHLSIGQKLVIRLAAQTSEKPIDASICKSSVACPTYTVQEGDTALGIAQLYHLSLQDLVALNGLSDPNALSIGQVLFVGLPAGSGMSSGSQP